MGMTVFAVYGSYFNSCDASETLLALYADLGDAREALAVLEGSPEHNRDQYFIREIEVL